MVKRVLFICYWSIYDGLTVSTVLPSLERLQEFSSIAKIYLVTIEREPYNLDGAEVKLPPKVFHFPLLISNSSFFFFRYIKEFVLFPKRLQELVNQKEINVILARGAPAGTMAHAVAKKYNLPYYVESYEPHADYMADSGVWSRGGLKYFYQKRSEQKQNKYAQGLMPVAVNYRHVLISEGVIEGKVMTVACPVDARFSHNLYERGQVRERFNIEPTAIVGIYVGKYSGLYLEDEAFEIYKQSFSLIPDFRLIILSPKAGAYVQKKLAAHDINSAKVYVAAVPHHEVPAYLSAADFAFATYKPGPSKKYLSPVKIGEYWANGLPVLLTEGVGDDSDIIKNEGGGATFNLKEADSLERALEKIQQIVKDPNHRQEIPKLAQKYRSPDRIKEAYEYFFRKEQEEQS